MVVDGTYITQPNMEFNGSTKVANVHLLSGVLHDEMAALLPYLGITSLPQSLLAFGFDPSIVQNSTLFPLPTGPNATLDVFNTTVHVATDYGIRCLSQAIAYAGITYDQFKSVWFYEFERSYQPAEFEVNVPICNAPITSTYPYGDTSLPYFR